MREIMDRENVHFIGLFRSSCPDEFCKKGDLKNFAKFTGKHLRQSLIFSKKKKKNFIKTETLAQVFSCEFCEIFTNTFRRLLDLHSKLIDWFLNDRQRVLKRIKNM